MRLGPGAWRQIADTLSEDALVHLIKALTVLERYPHFMAGSVSPVIWLFHCLPNASERGELINWILSHSENHYLPFGSSNFGAKTLDDYHHRKAEYAERRTARYVAEDNRQREAKMRKGKDASQKLFGAIRRKDAKAVIALLAQGADCNVVDESGHSAIQYAESIGFGHLFTTTKSQQDVPSDDSDSGGTAG